MIRGDGGFRPINPGGKDGGQWSASHDLSNIAGSLLGSLLRGMFALGKKGIDMGRWSDISRFATTFLGLGNSILVVV